MIFIETFVFLIP